MEHDTLFWWFMAPVLFIIWAYAVMFAVLIIYTIGCLVIELGAPCLDSIRRKFKKKRD
jgi:hypothetical protein